MASEKDKTRLDELNQSIYQDKHVVKWYINNEKLFPAENIIFQKFRNAFIDKTLLDIGVGGGRTTAHIGKFPKYYIGIDYSQEMVKGCQTKYPELTFEHCDARDLSKFEDETFDTVLFSFNGIDYVNHEGRLQILREIIRVLKPNGEFIFSTHNRAVQGHPQWIEHTINPLKYFVRTCRFLQSKLRHALKKNQEFFTDEYCIVNDGAHDYKLMTYYISPEKQIGQLQNVGFSGPFTLIDNDGVLPGLESNYEFLYFHAFKGTSLYAD